MNSVKKINKLIIYVIFSFGLFPIIPDKIKGFQIIIFFCLAVIFLIKEKPKKLDYKIFLVNSSLYIFYVFSLIYTDDLFRGINILTETRFTALIFPLIFLILSKHKEIYSKEVFKKFKKIFVFSTVIFCVIYFLFLPFKAAEPDPFFHFPSIFFFRNGLIEIPFIGIHPIYGSIYLGLSIIFILKDLIVTKIKPLQIVLLSIIITTLFLLSSKMTVIALILIGVFHLFYFHKNTYREIFFLVIAIIFSIGIISQIPSVKYRINELFKQETYTEYRRHNSTSIRISILKCGIQLAKNNFLFGVGIGDVSHKLVDCYKDISYDLVDKRYNSHNQYLSILITTGIFGLICFCYFLYINLALSFSLIDKTHFYLIIFYLFNFISENVLERQNGIILFFFLICYISHKARLHKVEKDFSSL